MTKSTGLIHSTTFFCSPFEPYSSRARILLRSLGPLQRSLLLSWPHSKIVAQCSESMSSGGRRPRQHSQCGRAKLRHLPTWIWYISAKNKWISYPNCRVFGRPSSVATERNTSVTTLVQNDGGTYFSLAQLIIVETKQTLYRYGLAYSHSSSFLNKINQTSLY